MSDFDGYMKDWDDALRKIYKQHFDDIEKLQAELGKPKIFVPTKHQEAWHAAANRAANPPAVVSQPYTYKIYRNSEPVVTDSQGGQNNPTHKYKIGTAIIVKDSKQHGIIKSQAGLMGTDPCYYITYDESWFGSEYVCESQMDVVQLPLTWATKCTCGSDKVFGDTGFHSSWCDKYERSK